MGRSLLNDAEAGGFTLLPGKSEIDVRVLEFVKAHKNDYDEVGQSQNFWVDFFNIFGRTIRPDAQFERRMRDDVAKEPRPSERIDLFWENILLIEQKSAKVDIKEAVKEAFYYYNNILEDKQPRYVLGCNFKTFHLYEAGGSDWKFDIEDLPKNLGLFEFMRIGAPVSTMVETPVNRKAAELMGKMYKKFKENNYDEDDLQLLLVRLAYCYFADDTGLFGEKGAFINWFRGVTDAPGKSAGPYLMQFFKILDKPVDKRQTTEKEFASFPYVNGGLFSDDIDTPVFDADLRQFVIDCGRNFNWDSISPAIFGNLFQGVMGSDTRHDSGAHYTTKDNIMRVIWPLFLERYWKEFEMIKNGPSKKEALREFQERLGNLEFFDPACGSGNFLIVAYEQLRELEIDLLKERWGDVPEEDRKSVEKMSEIKVEQFHGIEIHPFAVKIAQTSLWMMDHLMNKKLAAEFGKVYANLPLPDIKNIHEGDALEMDWNKVVESSDCSYVFGNPPFIGSKPMSADQKEQTVRITGSGQLDYVSNWFVKAGEYVNPRTPIGFVATNSITQGEQVGDLWSKLYELGLDIIFAYESFKWDSDAKEKAKVIVVVLGLSKDPEPGGKRIFSYDGKALIGKNHKYISPYIIGADVKLPIVHESSSSMNNLPEMKMGSKPIDGGNYIFTDEEKDEFLKKEPKADKFIRRFIDANGYINGKQRWILALHGISPDILEKLPEIKKRYLAVKEYRQKSTAPTTRDLDPAEYHLNVLPKNKFIIIPRTSSKRRNYVPMGFLEPPSIPADATMIIPDTNDGLFGLLTLQIFERHGI